MATLDPTVNFGKVEVSTGYDAAATSIVLSSGEGAKLPSTQDYNLTWWNFTDYPDPSDDPNKEIVRVTARTTDTLTVTRNQEGSGASTKNTAAKVYNMVLSPTAKTIDDLSGLRTTSIASSATPTPNGDTTDNYVLTALAVAATFGAPTGTPTNGQKLIIRILDNSTARALTWNAIYTDASATLPTTTVVDEILYVGLIYNSTSSKWECIAGEAAAGGGGGNKTIFVQMTTGTTSGTSEASIGRWPAHSYPDGASNSSYISWGIPSDLTTIDSATLIWVSTAATGNATWLVNTAMSGSGDTTTGRETDGYPETATATGGASVLNYLDISTAIDGLTPDPNDTIGFQIFRRTTGDTLTGLAYALGVQIEYS